MHIEHLEIKQQFFQTLNERQRRQYAALEARTLGHGGQRLVSQAFAIHVDTIRRGIGELSSGDPFPAGRVRNTGGGRKKNATRTPAS